MQQSWIAALAQRDWVGITVHRLPIHRLPGRRFTFACFQGTCSPAAIRSPVHAKPATSVQRSAQPLVLYSQAGIVIIMARLPGMGQPAEIAGQRSMSQCLA